MRYVVLAISFLISFALPAAAQTLSGKDLVAALKSGGYVMVMRHASSPMTPPDRAAADPENAKLERQLDDKGKSDSKAFAVALKKLNIPVGDVLTSPTFRARQMAKLAGFEKATVIEQLDEGAGGAGMGGVPPAQIAWLKAKAAETPRVNTNTVIITHTPNIIGTFGSAAQGVAAGEALIFRPDGKGEVALVARVKIEDWPSLTP